MGLMSHTLLCCCMCCLLCQQCHHHTRDRTRVATGGGGLVCKLLSQFFTLSFVTSRLGVYRCMPLHVFVHMDFRDSWLLRAAKGA